MSDQNAMLLLEPDPLLRRTVVMTARSIGLAQINEASSVGIASRLLRERAFDGVILALDFGDRKYDQYDLTLLDHIRTGDSASKPDIPIAVMLDHCDAAFFHELRLRNVQRVILKPFRARSLLDTFAQFCGGMEQSGDALAA
ncbi:response regulator [Noviherbaspirillum galbum]|uniref:Response regulator n=1 Tax=Noviherbaspirillum galbum TaxID=2709383 RepID=A0A6B3SRA8_9BURK|nr:response regulator [Noviherbaspirillum galbum]NEX63181.1 response regulator [Noviherbaspirillum galbum]